MAGFNTDFFPIFYQTGGGGSTIPTITADATLNVPATYPTINDALDYVRSAVVLNGAQVTIAVNGAAYVCNEQINITGENLSFVKISATAPVSVDTTGFVVNTLFGVPGFFVVLNSELGEVTGSWAYSAGGPALGFLGIKSKTAHGNLSFTPTQFTGFLYNYYGFTNEHVAISTTYNNAIVADAVVNGGSVQFNGGACTSVAGIVPLQIEGGAIAHLGGGMTLTAIDQVALSSTRCAITSDALNMTTGQAGALFSGTRCTLQLDIAGAVHDTNGNVFNVQECDGTITCASLTTLGTNNPNYIYATGGQVSINTAAFVGAASLGSPATAINGGIIQVANPVGVNAAFTGAYAPAINVPVAAGLIIA